MSRKLLKPVRLKTWPDRDSEAVSTILRDAVKWAKGSKSRSVLVMTVDDDAGGMTAYHYGTGAHFQLLLGRAEEWKATALRRRAAQLGTDEGGVA